MYQSQQNQQFHTANYRGNQQGHDNYLRSDSQSPSSFGTQNVASQYRGNTKTFQPTGLVNSVYGQNQVQSGYNQSQIGSQNASSSYGSFANSTMGTGIQNYHTANYRGDQPGHDNYLRADSTQPSQAGYASVNQQSSFNSVPAYSSFGTSVTTGVNNTAAYNQSQNQNQFVSPASYHTANYRGDQPGHDNYLRSDSVQTAQSQYGIGANSVNYNTNVNSAFSNLNNAGTSSYGGSSYGSATTGLSNIGTSFGSQSGQVQQNQQYQSQFVSPNSFHTANYRGDQPGHDNYLRSDSTQTAQSQFGGSNQNQTNLNTMNTFNTNKF